MSEVYRCNNSAPDIPLFIQTKNNNTRQTLAGKETVVVTLLFLVDLSCWDWKASASPAGHERLKAPSVPIKGQLSSYFRKSQTKYSDVTSNETK